MSAITSLTPELVAVSKKVVQQEVEHIEPLHKLAEEWAGRITYLQNFIDGLVDKWKKISDKVTDAAKMGNKQLLQAQVFLWSLYLFYTALKK